MLDQPSRGDITTSSKRPSGAAQAQGILAAALQGLSAIYASAAKVTLEAFEDLADRRAELRAERLAPSPERGVLASRKPSRPVKARQSIVSAPKRAPKSR
jgi:tRNA (Thr-GGU) A37 N-methylase